MSEAVIVVEGLSKRYAGATRPRGVPEVLWRRLRATSAGYEDVDDDDEDDDFLDEPDDRPAPPARDDWAIRDLSFEVGRGEAVALVGANGSGKTTVLRVLSRLTPPTEGRATVRGRMLPLGSTVFSVMQPGHSGRHNAYLIARFFGVPTELVDRRIDEIAAFAELGPELDRNMGTYSGGLRSRLAASVVLHLDPDILIADDRLVAGDGDFQARCMARVRELVQGGAALLFSSHDLELVEQVAGEAIWLDHGRVREIGPASEIARAYRRSRDLTASQAGIAGPAAIAWAGLVSPDRAARPQVGADDDVVVRVELDVSEPPAAIAAAVRVEGAGGFVRELARSFDVSGTGTYFIQCHLPPGSVPGGAGAGSVDVVVSRLDGDDIRLDRGFEFQVAGDEADAPDPREPDLAPAPEPFWEIARLGRPA